MLNPYADPWRVLGVDPAAKDAFKAAIVNWLKNHPEVQTIPDNTVRALHPALANDLVWNQLKAEIEAGG